MLGQQRMELLQHLVADGWRESAPELRLSDLPVEAFDLVGQDHARDRVARRDLDLEGITLNLAGDRAEQG